MAILYGFHVVEQALKAVRPLERILVVRGRSGRRLAELLAAARGREVPIRFVSREEADRLAGTRAHQGVLAVSGAKAYIDLEELLRSARQPALFVLLDGVEDPHNLGAIVRTAYCAGADGLILPARRAVGVTAAVAKASAGAVEHLPIARVTNLVRAMARLKQNGCWLIGLDERAPLTFTEVDLSLPCGLVFGGEGRGLHQLVREKCDFLASIPTYGAITSLNVSVAAAVVLYEAVRQRRSKGLLPPRP